MKHIIVSLVACLLIAGSAMAQTNPKAGCIFTNEQDTIAGVIDYLSDVKNAQACLFKADGATSFQAYTPEQISGYQLQESGIRYVRRTLPCM